ncbi:MAG TPA: N,N-dimethylformamidase beta subunit family domain-containing protein, partial [Acidimicrobiales bacterium]|nr:N,N-dimethylformamidase beta subunit family domain-containing protein [Acidimicrobiales bacterium]
AHRSHRPPPATAPATTPTTGPTTTTTEPTTTTTGAATRTRRRRAPAVFPGRDGPKARWVGQENRRPGTDAWKLTGHQSATGIMGYADRVQARVGQRVRLYVSTTARTFRVDAFRMGYYHGKGARLVWRSPVIAGHRRPSCPVRPGINMVECHWPPSLRFAVTRAWVQGQYLLKLVGAGGQQSYIPLTIWDPSSHATYVIMDGVLTTQVFNPFGGYDLYQGATPCAPDVYPCSSRSLVVSFDRPYAPSFGDGAGTYFSLVYPLTRFAEERGLDVTYWTDITLATDGRQLSRHKVLISTGHDEEWSLSMRNAAEAAVRRGVNLIFFGASPILRKVRLQPSPLGPDREIVNYRDPLEDPLYGHDNAEVSQNQWIQPPADWSPSRLVGANYVGYNNDQSFPLVDTDPSSWLWAGTGLRKGAKIPGVLRGDFQAYEPEVPDPPGVEILSHSPVIDQANPAYQYADVAYYTMRSGRAGVFESGTTDWIPSMAACSHSACPAHQVDRLTGNLLRVFGAGPVGDRHPSRANFSQYYG